MSEICGQNWRNPKHDFMKNAKNFHFSENVKLFKRLIFVYNASEILVQHGFKNFGTSPGIILKKSYRIVHGIFISRKAIRQKMNILDKLLNDIIS